MGAILPMTIINQAAGAAATEKSVWIPLVYDQCNNVTFHVEDGGNTGTITVEVSNDMTCLTAPTSDNANEDITTSLTITNPAGVAADQAITISNVSAAFIRYVWTYSGAEDQSHIVRFSAHTG